MKLSLVADALIAPGLVADGLLAAVLLAATLPGCKASSRPDLRETPAESTKEESLNHGYALLHDLVSKQSDAHKVFFLKDAAPRTKSLVRVIAAVCREARTRLEAFDAEDPDLRMELTALPWAEIQTREAIKKATTREILLGDSFELTFVISQVKSTQYGAYLAETLAEEDTHEERRKWLRTLAKVLKDLHTKITARLKVKSDGPFSSHRR